MGLREYAAACTFWALAAIALGAILRPKPGARFANIFRVGLVGLCCALFAVSVLWTVAYRGDEPWTNFLRLRSKQQASTSRAALIAMTGTSVTRDDARRSTVFDLTLENLGSVETVGKLSAALVINGRERQTGDSVPERLTFGPGQKITLALGVLNKSQAGFDAIWNGRDSVEARVAVQFESDSKKRTYVYRGALMSRESLMNTLQSEYMEGWERPFRVPPSNVEEYVKSWGLVGDGRSLFAEVETSELVDFSTDSVIIVAALHRDYAVDPLSDARLQVGGPFEITGQRIRVEIQVSDSFKRRLNSSTKATISFYLCLLPKNAIRSRITRLADIEAAGGYIVGYRHVGGPLKMH